MGTQQSLRRFVVFDEVTCLGAVAVMLNVHLWLHRTPYLLLLAGVVGLAAGVMELGRRAVARGDLVAAVSWMAAANWGVSLTATAVATFCVPITVVAAMLPSVLAVPYVDTRSLRRISAVSMAVSFLVVAVSSAQDFSGLTADLPGWIPPAVLLAFVPFVTGMVVMVSTNNAARLTRSLVDLGESRARMVAATDRERRRIARDLHDGAQQRLTALAMRADRIRRVRTADPEQAGRLLDLLCDDLRDSMAEMRDLAYGVYPSALTDRGLGEALAEFAARSVVPCRLKSGAVPRCAPEVEASLYWCCVEAVQNVAKHAGDGARAWISLGAGVGTALAFSVEDDGCGFDPSAAPPGQGLVNMADRIGAVGGELAIASQPGRGVRIHGWVPSAVALDGQVPIVEAEPHAGVVDTGLHDDLGRSRDPARPLH